MKLKMRIVSLAKGGLCNIVRTVVFICLFTCITVFGSIASANNIAQEYDLCIEKKTLGGAMDAIVQQTDVVVLYPFELANITGMNPVNGRYALDEAIEILFRNTEFLGGLTKSGMIVITRKNDANASRWEGEEVMHDTVKKSLLAGAAAALLAAASGPNAVAQEVGKDGAKVEKTNKKKVKKAKKKAKDQIIITGSRIARSNYNTSSPILVIEAIEFEQMGATSVFEMLSLLPEIGTEGLLDSSRYRSSFGELTAADLSATGFDALGADSVSLRSLGSNATLILVNGRRIAPHSLVNGNPSVSSVVTNLDNIPLEAIERVEILKDGASTIYGSDAMAGVINIILKKEYLDMRSITGNVKMSTQWDNAEYRLAYAQGFSNLGGGDNTLSLSGEYVHQANLAASQRAPGRETAHSRGGTLRRYDPTLRKFVFEPYNAAACDKIGDDNECIDDVSALTDITPASDRMGMTAVFDHRFSSGLELYSTATISRRTQINRSPPQEVSIYRFSGSSYLLTQLTDIGNQERKNTTTSMSFVGGAKGEFGSTNIHWDLSGRYSLNLSTVNYKNFMLHSEYFQAYLDRTYKFGFPGETPVDLINKIRAPEFQRKGRSVSYGANAHITGNLFELPGGTVSYAVGGTYSNSSFKDKPSDLVRTYKIWGSPGGFPYEANRSNSAVFGELSIPVVKDMLHFDVSGREDFDDLFGSHFSPKIGFRFEPIPDIVMIRGAYNEGFRAPSIVEFGRKTLETEGAWWTGPRYSSYVCADGDPRYLALGYPQCRVKLTILDNPDIQPETSKQFGLGLVLKPFDNLDLAFDWYKIKRTNEIRYFHQSNIAYHNPEDIQYNAAGEVIGVIAFFGNVGKTENQGVDFSSRYTVDLGKYGELTNRMSIIRNITVSEERNARLSASVLTAHRVGWRGMPKWRATNTLSWSINDWRAALTYRYRGSFREAPSRERPQLTTCDPSKDLAAQNRISCTIPAFDTFDLNLGYTGFKNIRLTFNVRNMFDEIQISDLSLTDPRNFRRIGRELSFRANYRF